MTASSAKVRQGACVECGAELREGVKFCTTCGRSTEIPVDPPPAARVEPSPDAPNPDVPSPDAPSPDAPAAAAPSPDAPTPSAAVPKPAAPAPAPATTITGSNGQNYLLPAFPLKAVWSPRKTWTVNTRLSDAEITEIFTATMTKDAHIFRKANNYYRRVSWTVNRHGTRDELVATCVPNGLVTVGFGQNKKFVDVSGNTIVCLINRPSPDARAKVTIGVEHYTRWWGFYMYPATTYSYDIVKALKRADRAAGVGYPWSIARIAAWALVAVMFLISAAGGGGSSNNGYSSSDDSYVASNSATPDTTESYEPTDSTDDYGSNETVTTDVPDDSTGSDVGEDTGPPPKPKIATVPSEASNGAQRAVVKYWTAIGDGDYGDAYDLYSTRMMNARAGERSAWIENEEDQEITSVSPEVRRGKVDGRSAKVKMEVVTEDRHGCNHFRGSYVVRKIPGEGWRIDDQNLKKTSC